LGPPDRLGRVWSSDSGTQRRLDGRAGLEGSEDVDCGDRLKRQLGCDVGSDHCQPQHLDVQRLASIPRRLQLLTGKMAKPEVQLMASDGLLDDVAMPLKLIADRRADEIGPVGIETVADQQIDLSQINKPQVDGDLLAVGLGPERANFASHRFFHPCGWYMDVFRMIARRRLSDGSVGRVGGAVACGGSGATAHLGRWGMEGETEPHMSKLDQSDRDHLSAREYAFPKQRKEPLEDAKHVRNAVARFDQVKDVTDAERDDAWKRIEAAAKKFDVALEERSWRELGKPKT
jgi:hypothetical protein